MLYRMLARNLLFEQLPQVLTRTNLDYFSQRYEGKVRDCYLHRDLRFLVASDRLSCFDRIVSAIPFKGEVLTQLAAFWFNQSKGLIDNHLVDVPDPNVMLVRNCQMIPVEVVVRAYLSGSAWRDYAAGRTVSGLRLPPGLKAHQKLEHPIITPSTKAPVGQHDIALSEEELIARGIVEPILWGQIREAALALFAHASAQLASRGLLLVDTKYEFGLFQGKLLVADEIHTLDCSRFWVAASYPERYAQGQAPEMLDKEPVRQLLLAQGFSGEGDVPPLNDVQRVEIAEHYLRSYQLICGTEFSPHPGQAEQRIYQALQKYAA
jgi:phosphoribosylaminoimidazole-succinocarboxamide synthase